MHPKPRVPVDAGLIPLTLGYVAIVDRSDFDWLSQWPWYAARSGNRLVYAVRDEPLPGGRLRVAMHQLLVGDVPPGQVVHHRNGISIDDRRSNLLVGPRTMPLGFHSPGVQGKRSQFRGVYLAYQTQEGQPRWEALVTVRGQRHYLGSFEEEIDAAIAWDKAVVRYYGPEIYVNFPDKVEEYEAEARRTRTEPPLLRRHAKRSVKPPEDLDHE